MANALSAIRRPVDLDTASASRHRTGMTASELRDILVRDITRTHGGSTARWRRLVGSLKVYSRTTHAHCNWEARPSGSPHDIAIAEQAIDAIRPRFPYIDEG
jgi:hypothetical protein